MVDRRADRDRFEAAADAVEAADPGSLVFGAGRPPHLAGPRPRRRRDRRHRARQRLRPRVALPRRAVGATRSRDGATPTRRASGRPSPTASRAGVFAPVDPALTAAYILTALNGLVAWYRPDGRLHRARDRRRLRATSTLPRRPAPTVSHAMTDPLALEPILGPRSAAARPSTRTCRTTSGSPCSRRTSPAGGKVEATDWMPDEYRTAVLRFVEMHANSELMGVLPEREWLMRAPDAPPQARADRQGPGRGRPRPAAVPRRRGPRQAARGDVRRPAGRQDQVPQRLPLPDGRLGRRRDHRLAGRRRRDRRPAGAARLVATRRTPGRCARSAGRNRSTSCTAAMSS